jgi:hypothetical protein
VASQLSEQNAVNLAERYRAWGADSLAALGGWQLAYYEGRFLGLGVGLVAVCIFSLNWILLFAF